MTRLDAEQLGQIVRDTWVKWAAEQPDPKPSWLTPWSELDDGQREVDMRIGEAIADAERNRLLNGPVSWIEPDPDQPGYNRGVTSIDAMIAQAVAAERERIRQLAESRAVTLIRPGLGLGHDEGVRVVPLAELREVLADPSVPAVPAEGTTP